MSDLQFQLRVRELIPANHERDTLFEALRRYQSHQNLHQLLTVLRLLLSEPKRLELYGIMRPLILLRHQLEYSCRVPGSPRSKFRVVKLDRRAGENLGFCLKGGYEHGVGIFVTDITPGSQADRRGLKIGDEIVRVNGFTISEAIHDEVLNLIRLRNEIVLKVTYIGMVPIKDDPMDAVTWEYVDESPFDPENESMALRKPKDLNLFVDTTGHASFGCGIRSGPRSFPGIFIERVQEESLAAEVGLETGDQIMEVNETIFTKISHKEAVLALKGSHQLNLVIRKKTGLKLFRGGSGASVSGSMSSSRVSESAFSIQNHTPTDSYVDHEPVVPDERAAPQGVDRSSGDWQQASAEQVSEQGLSSLQLHQKKRAPPPPTNQPPASRILTSVEVHKQEDQSALRTLPPSYPSVNPFSGAQAVKAERKLLNDNKNYPTMLARQGDYEWSDKVPADIYERFSVDALDGRLLKCLKYKKSLDLGIDVEGGLGSPLGGKILVAMIFEGGVAQLSGRMHVGDQLMMIAGQSMVDITVASAERMIQAMTGTTGDSVQLIYCESTLINDEDSMTYF